MVNSMKQYQIPGVSAVMNSFASSEASKEILHPAGMGVALNAFKTTLECACEDKHVNREIVFKVIKISFARRQI